MNMEKVEWHVRGMTCTNCANTVKKALENKGLRDVNVSFPNSEANFINDSNISEQDIKKTIQDFGYFAEPLQENDHLEAHNHESHLTTTLFWITVPFSLMLLSHMFLSWHWLAQPLHQFLLALPVVSIGIYYFGKSAFLSIKGKSINMDVLISIGFSSAFFYSTYALVQELGPNYLFFETASTIISLVLLGNLIEKKAVAQTSNAVKDLMALQETKSMVFRDEKWIEIEASSIVVDDTIKLISGNQIPTDGILIEGECWVNEAMISGESIPVYKTKGVELIGSTTLSDGAGLMKATKVGKATVISQIIKLLKQAQNDHPAIQRVGDKVSAVFVPIVIAIASLTLFGNMLYGNGFEQSMLNAIAVLVISCPCAMGLATPTAVMVGLGKATQKGILIKSGETIERLKHVDTIVFDKTGTLTNASFSIESLKHHTQNETEAIDMLYSLELHSTHPIAKAIVAELKSTATSIPLSTISEVKGKGMIGIDKQGETWELKGGNTQGLSVELFKNKELVLSLAIEDSIKPGAKTMIDALKNQGKRVVMLSGDNAFKCAQVAEKLGIKDFISEQSPEDKLNYIKKMSTIQKIAMIGDGINDAPALHLAHVGISFANASQIAVNSSKVVVLGESLEKITQLFAISHKTYTTIVQNLYWAFLYNIVAIPMAAVGLVSPMLGALTMAFSDVVVIGNSIRLKFRKFS